MKKTILLLVLAAIHVTVLAQHSLQLYDELSNEESHQFIATDHILLSSGFKSEPKDGCHVHIDIDPYDASPPNIGIQGGPGASDDGVVGAIKGNMDVQGLGAATYTIPIEMPVGLGEMKPQLFIYYNNQIKNGLLGWNWDLGGLSAITRTGGTLYHDGYTSPVNYSTDRFCLDGQRLLKVSSGIYGADETTYHTELDQMSKIVSYTEAGINGPSYFKVMTEDGKICYYGNSQDSKALMTSTNHVTTWLLKSIEDRYGNIITYHYENGDNDYYITEIEYSGNKTHQINPSLSVHFQYQSRNDIEYIAHGSCLQKKDRLLKTIIVRNKGNDMYTYAFNYQAPNPHEGYSYHFLTSIGFSAGNQHINPTKIEWTNNNYNITVNNTSVSVTTNSIDCAFVKAIKFSGDFNGDGFTDVIAVKRQNGTHSNQAEVFLNRGVSGDLIFDHIKTLELFPFTNWIYIADLDGDGNDDIVLTDRITEVAPNVDYVTTKIYLCKKNVTGNLMFISYQIPTQIIPKNRLEALLIGDFMGEGKQSILIQILDNNDKNSERSLLIQYNDSSSDFELLNFSDHLSATRFYPADYNGDGVTEILYKNSSGYTSIAKLSTNNGNLQYTSLYTGNPYQWDDCFPGDFNGDGTADALFYTATDIQKWFIRLSTQTGISSTKYPLPSSFPYQSPGNYHFSLNNFNETNHFINIGDFDGNGCSDLILWEGDQVHVYYGPINTSSEDYPFSNHRQVSTQVFQYFSNLDLCTGNFLGKDNLSFLGNYTLSRLPSTNISHEVKRITDGMGRQINFEYDYLMPNPKNPSESDFYYMQTPHACSSRKVYSTYLPLRALKKATTYNIKNKPVTIECHYEGALLHRQGKGFLGFSKIIQKDYCNAQLQKKTIREFEFQCYDPVIHLSMTSEEVLDKNDALMASTTYSNVIYTNQKNDKVYVPIEHKTIEEYDMDHPETMIKKEIYETTVENHCTQPYQYNNIISVVQTLKGVTDKPYITMAQYCMFQEKTITTYKTDNTSQWLVNRPKTITHIAHREGNYDDICHHKIFSYNSNKPYQVKYTTEIPNNGDNPNDRMTVKTTFKYDITGNITSKTVSTPNDDTPPRTESYSYSADYGRRLLTKHTDAAGHTTKYKYHNIYDYCILITDCNNLKTKYEQDPFGITSKTTHPDGTITYKAIRWNGGKYYTWEKKTGMPTKIIHCAKTGEIERKTSYSLNGEEMVSTIQYDDMGRIIEEKYPFLEGLSASKTVNYYYDTKNRIHEIHHSDGTREYIYYNGNQTSTSFQSTKSQIQSESKTVNVMGWVIQSTDANGVNVIYDYYPDGKIKSTQIEGHDETLITMDYDGHGNRIYINDPNYGLTSFEYNAFNELTRQISPKQDITDYEYDLLGNRTRRTETNPQDKLSSITEWQYGNEDGKYGILMKIISENQTVDYEYDQYLRLKAINDRCFGKDYKTNYTYDQASRISSLTYPSNYTIHYCYTSEGMLRCITDDTFKELWRAKSANTLGMPTQFVTGNGLISEYYYDPNNNKLTKIKTMSGDRIVQDYEYEYDDFSNMKSRTDVRHGQSELFTYDALNRLTSVVDNDGESVFCYDALGRMTSKTQSGQLVFSEATYGENKPHAMKSAITTPDAFPSERMDLDYSTFGKVTHIQEGTKQVSYQYGYDHQRIRAEENMDGQIREKIYVNDCEFITQPDGTTVTRTFLSGTTGVFAVVESVNGDTSLHYIHKDHLGSWTLITDNTGEIEQENKFDAWGVCENAETLMFDRGFTGHEHIKGMKLINMNGRIYDPVTSSMLSPDNYVQMPDFTQNFNRYAYSLNNPLSYIDPDGNTFVESALLLYFLLFTETGYEFQKYASPIAVHIDIHLSSQQKGVGIDVSIGFEKTIPASYRMHFGATYYWKYYDDSYHGWEFRVGGEWCFNGLVGYSGTTFYTKGGKQTTNSIIVGNFLVSASYENDYMFNIGKYLFGIPPADNGDRYRTAAAKVRFAFLSIGCNIFTGDPGHERDSRCTFLDPDSGKLTYTLNGDGDDPDQYRAGILYMGIGPIKIGVNSEKIRHCFQNRFAHDLLCRGDSPYFKVLDRPTKSYIYFGSETGGTLW